MSRARAILVCFVTFTVLTPHLGAQITTGSISGYVVDPSGKPVSGAVIRVIDQLRSTSREAVTDARGAFTIFELPPAAYTVAASAAGFEEVTAGNIRLAVDAHVRLDFRLPIAGLREKVQVSTTVSAAELESSELGRLLDEKTLQSLPLNRRDFLQLALFTAGVLPPVEDSELSTRGSFAMHANGGREEFNNFLLDGADNNDPYVNRYVLQPSVDSIQEFRIATNSYDAQYGRSAAGQVNVITRSGSNVLHGFAYDYLRNRVLDTRNFFDGSSKPDFIRNQFGFGLGGPVVRDKAWFFAASDFLRQKRGLSRLSTVPGRETREGDLSGLGRPVVDPFTRKPFPGNIIPSERISPIARKVLELFPLPNRAGDSGNYLPRVAALDNQSQASFRLDYNPRAEDQLTIRYSYGFNDLFEPYAEDTDAVAGFGDFVRDPAHNAVAQHQHVFGARTIHTARFGFNRFAREILPENHTTDAGRLWGVSWLQLPERAMGYPAINVAGYSRIGDSTGLPIIRDTSTWQFADGLTHAIGNHVWSLGGEVRHLRLHSTLDLLARGSLSFSGALTGSGIGDLLLGLPSFGLQSKSDNPMSMRSTAYDVYFQDNWKLTPALVLNLGLRYEFNSPPADPRDRMYAFNFAAGKPVQVGTDGSSRSGMRPDRNNLAPRAGLAWRAFRDVVLRAGYGIYYDSGMFITSTAQYFNPPLFNLRVFFPTATSLLTLRDPFPVTGGITPPPSLNILSPDAVGSYMQHWNVNLQQPWGDKGLLSLAYAGSKGTHLVRVRDLNQAVPGPGDVQARRPYRSFGGMLFVESGANSAFHSLQATVSRPLGRHVSLWGVYTFSKSIDDASAFLDTKGDKNFPQNSSNVRAERGLSSFHLPHRLSLAYVFELPSSRRMLRNTEIRGMTVAQSGQPFTPILRFDNSNSGNTGGSFGSDRPNLLTSPNLGSRGPEQWFDTGAFAVAPRYSFGNSGRNVVRGPGFFTFDLAVARKFRLSDRWAAALEAQAFNLFNRANFDLPELYADEPATFGRIFSAKVPRQIQLVLRLTF